MEHENAIARYAKLYARLLRLYSKPYRDRFGKGMEQTFNDLCRERDEGGTGLFAFAIWAFAETSGGILRERTTFIIMHSNNIIRIALATASILLLPLLAMQFSDEVVWDLADFAVAGALLFGAGLTYELVARKADKIAYRAAVGLGLVAAFLLVWVNGAVGIIGAEGNDANLMYGGVLAVGLIGAVIARFQPHGMARALCAMALAQALVPVIALIIWPPRIISWGAAGAIGVFVLNAFWVVLFVVSALLFRNAAPKQPPVGEGPKRWLTGGM